MDPNRLLDFKEIARYLNVSQPTLYRMIRDRAITAYKVQGKWKFKPEDLAAYLESACNRAGKELERESVVAGYSTSLKG